jgi:uracil phosphoribosyltransferase
MVQAIQEIVPLIEVAHVGLRRDEATLRSDVYLNRLPRDLRGRRVIVCDPMPATGGSLGQVCDLVAERGAAEVVALCIIASEPGLATFRADHPRVAV